MSALAIVLDVVTALLLVHTIVNACLLRRPPSARSVGETVSVLVPVRDEAARAPACVSALVAQTHLRDAEVLVGDDGSTDGTADLVRSVGGDRVRILTIDAEPGDGVLGKPAACARLAAAARGSVLVFVDADVVLAPDAVARSVLLLRQEGLQLVSPYPRQLAVSWMERLVQPLLQWSWLTLLPLRLSERSRWPSLSAANGQLLVVDAATYHAGGGHAAVLHEVLDDVALARVLHAHGAQGGFVDGSELATCRMYDGRRSLVDGYAKSLWTAFGSPVGAVAVSMLLVAVYVLPWVLLAWTWWALPAVAAGLLGRVLTALRTGGRALPDAVVHPLSVLAFVALVAVSLRRRRAGALTWKGRPVG